MSIPIDSLQPWIFSDLYNIFPTIENARELVDEEYQVSVGKALALEIPQLIGRFGTTLTHGHHVIKEGQAIIGSLENGCLFSIPKNKNSNICPTTWVVVNGKELVATEGIENAPREVIALSHQIKTYANKIFQNLQPEIKETFSKLSIAIDPRIIFGNPHATYFLEKNNSIMSILTPERKANLQDADKKNIPTYKSIDLPQDGILTEGGCGSYCATNLHGDHLAMHYTVYG